jgi:hypothetical protein
MRNKALFLSAMLLLPLEAGAMGHLLRDWVGGVVYLSGSMALRPDNLMDLNAKAFALERRAEANELLRRANAIDGCAHRASRAMVLEFAR